jgi:hypothetical protein
LLKKYVLPTYDPMYVCLAARDDFNIKRQWIEDIWLEYQQFADWNFAKEFKRQFSQRVWELYLGITLHKRWGLEPGSKSKRESAGPDFKTIHITNKGAQTVWIEAIAVEKGSASNRVPEMVFTDVADLPEDLMLLRLTSGLADKYKKYCKDVEQGIVGTGDPYIIAINRSKLEHLDPQIPLILKCLFRLEWLILFPELKKLDLKAGESFWTTRDYITKVGGSDTKVSTGFFDNPEHSGISAVIYVETDIINSPILPEELGNNFIIVLNPHAKNPLPEELLTFGNIWRTEGDQIFLMNAFPSNSTF